MDGNKIIAFSLGSVLAFFGVHLILKPRFYSSKYSCYLDFSELKWVIGGAFLFVGVLIIWAALRRKANNSYQTFWICPKCENVFRQTEANNSCCRKCATPLEKLTGFYQNKH